MIKTRDLLSAILLLTFSGQVYSQSSEYSGEIHLRPLVSNTKQRPFWFYSNQRGRASENTNISGLINGRAEFYLNRETSLELGGGVLYQDGLSDQIFIDELYAHFENYQVYITAGRKQRKELYNGLSATNESILWSLNARPLPGLQIGTSGPAFFNYEDGLGIEVAWEEYFLEEDRFMSRARLHHKNFYLVYRSENNWQVKAGLEHFALWGGASEAMEEGGGLRDYFRAIAGRAAEYKSGNYEFYFSKSYRIFKLEFLYNYFFENLRAGLLRNFPDGRYGIFIESHDKDRMVNSLMYEFYYTHNQGGSEQEDYFNNRTYRSGWTYEKRIMGVPFFTYDKEQNRVVNNKFRAHHLGVAGQFSDYFSSFPYRILISYINKDGTYARRIRPNQEVISLYYSQRIYDGTFKLQIEAAADFNSLASPIYGAAIHLKKEF